jgi:hypothetical protein
MLALQARSRRLAEGIGYPNSRIRETGLLKRGFFE